MKWVLISKTYVNTDTVTAFRWTRGTLYVFFIAEKEPTEWEDPNQALYRKLCSFLELNVCEEG